MKTSLLLAQFLLTASAFAQLPKPGDSFTCPASIPQGVNSATYSVPRYQWVERALRNISDARRQADKIELVFDGDSITDFWRGQGAQPLWKERYGQFNAFNFGIGGDRTEHVLWRLSQGQADGLRPKLIAIMIGTNNISSNSVEEIAEGIKAVVSEYQKHCPDAVILLQAIFPRGEKGNNPVRAKIKSINEIISKIGDNKKVIFADFGEKFLDAEGNISKEIMVDFTHPTRKGYQIWADAIQPYIERYLGPVK